MRSNKMRQLRRLTMAVVLSVIAMPLAAATFRVILNDQTAITNHGTVQDFDLNDPDCDVDNNPAAPHNCTFLAAIQQANFNANRDRIEFLAGLNLITLSMSLPSIMHPVDIEGNVSGSAPLTAINAANNGLLTFDNTASLTGGSSVTNLKLMNAGGTGISLDGTPYILDNLWIGLNAAGTAAAGSNQNGIVIQNTVSKLPPVLSDINDLLSALGISSFGELFTAFGTNPTAFVTAATALLGQDNAIAITNSVISGNGDAGVRIAGGLDGMGGEVLTAGVILAGNRIGTNALGTDTVPNGTGTTGDGSGVTIEIKAALNFVIGNVIAANEGQGVSITAGEVDFPNVVGGNFIGLPNPIDVPNPLSLGPSTWGNFESGVFLATLPSAGNAAGTSAVVAANFIGFNRCGTWSDPDGLPPFSPEDEDGGIAITNSGGAAESDKTIVVGNLIGVAQFPPTGGTILDLGNLCHGINVSNGSHIIGGANILDANAVGANDGDGILLRSSFTNGSVLKGNRIGRDYLDMLTFPNDGYGIRLINSGGNIVGFQDGDAPLFGPNIIASPGASGIRMEGANAFGNLLRRNRIYGVPANFIGIELDRDNLLGQDVPDPIDDDDTDVNPLDYANWGQNAPQICSTGGVGTCAGATSPGFSAGNTNVQWTLFSFRNATFRIDFYSISDDDARWLSEDEVSTDATGTPVSSGPCNAQALCTSSIAAGNTSGTQIVMTATRIDENIADIPPLEPVPPGNPNDDGPINNTSEYSAPAAIPDQIVFSSANYVVAESDGNASITVSRIGAGAASITLTLTDLTTQAADHGALSATTLTWAAGEAEDKLVTLPIVQDAIDEPNQSLSLDITIDSSDNAVEGTPSAAQVTITDDDSAPLLTISAANAVEGDQLVYTVTRNGGSEFTVSVDYAVTPVIFGFFITELADIAAGVDPLTGTVSIPPGATTGTISVLAVNDTIHEPAEAARASLTNPVNGALNPIGGNFADAIIAASDAPPVFNIDSPNATETDANAPLVFTVSKVGLTELAAEVDYAAIAGSATTPADYLAGANPLSATLIFAAGVAQQTISLTLVGDDTFEVEQSFSVGLSNPLNASLGVQPGVATITDDDSPPPAFTVDDPMVAETDAGGPLLTFTVSRSDATLAASIDVATANGTAIAGSDYTAIPTMTLNFGIGVASLPVNVAVLGDNVFEGNETLLLNLSNNSAGTSIADAQGVGTITDDETIPTLTLADVVPTDEGNAGDTPFGFVATLSHASTQAVSFTASTGGGSATSGSDYTALSAAPFAIPALSTLVTVTVQVTGETAFESDETFDVTLAGVTNAVAGDFAASATIRNDDPPPVNGALQFSAATYTVGEAGVSATITVTRTGGSSGPVGVTYATTDGSATTAGSDYTAAAGTLSWLDTDVAAKTFSVPINNDGTDEPDETLSLTLSLPTGGAVLGGPGTAVLTITDDDAPASGVKTFNAPTTTGSGIQNVVFIGGGDPCGFVAGTAPVATPQPLPPGGYVFPHGVFASTIANCVVGATLNFAVTYPQALPAGTVFWKYGRTLADPSSHWYQYPAVISGASATFTLTDGGAGDDDLVANGSIADLSGPAFFQGFAVPAGVRQVPALDDYGRWLLLTMIGLLAGFALRKRT